jgi:ribonuclease-3
VILAVADLDVLEQIIGVTFRDRALLEQALVHRSYLNENPDFALPSNERLEFLGDAVVGLVVAEKLYHEFPHLCEGKMTKLRAALVRQETLASLAASLGLGGYLRLGRGEEVSGGRSRQTNLARAFEAVVGAVFLDQGFAVAADSTLRLFGDQLHRITEGSLTADYKSRLQEVVQAEQRLTPVYRVVEASGPDHDKRFVVEVMVGDIVIGRGVGRSKRMADEEAAWSAIERLSADGG